MIVRDALLFSDGSLSVFPEDWPLKAIENERADSDKSAPRAKWTKIVRVTIGAVDVTYDPAAELPSSRTELEAELLAALKATVQHAPHSYEYVQARAAIAKAEGKAQP